MKGDLLIQVTAWAGLTALLNLIKKIFAFVTTSIYSIVFTI